MSDSMNAIDVTYQTEISIENKSTEQLTAETNTFYRQAEQLAGMSATMLAEAGRRLIEVKSRIPHGDFVEWCENNLEFSYRKAARMMQLAEKVDDENSLISKMPTLATIGISRVWELLAAPEEVAAEVIETNDVESMTVRELKEEITRIKEEKADAERLAKMAENSNDDIRKELASMQRKLSEAISEEDFDRMKSEYEEEAKSLRTELGSAKADAAVEIENLNQKLEKAKKDLKTQKEKLKELEDSKDEDIQKRLAEAGAELEEKARADAQKEAEAALKEKADAIQALESQVSALEAEKAKLSNTALMEFKVYVDQLQDIYWRINEIITEQNEKDPETGLKMQKALHVIVEEWRP